MQQVQTKSSLYWYLWFPYLTKELAFCLFNEVDATLEYDQSSHRPQHGSGGLFEVTEFCSALAASCVNSNSATLNLMPGVRRKLLKYCGIF